MPNKKFTILISTIILTIVITIIGISYSSFSNEIIKGGTHTVTNVNSIDLNVKYKDDKIISLENVAENDIYIKNIIIENKSNYNLNYNLNLKTITNTYTNSIITYDVKVNDNICYQNIPIQEENILKDYSIKANETQQITIFIYIKNLDISKDNQATYKAELSVYHTK